MGAMEGLGDVTVKRALLLLGAFIVLAGFALTLVSGFFFGTFGSFTNTNYIPQSAADVIVNPRGNPYGTVFYENLRSGIYIGPGPTQVIRGVATNTSTGGPFSSNGTGSVTVGTGSLLEFSNALTIQSPTPQLTASGVVALAYSAGGYVAYQATYKDSAYLVIRVPASQFPQTLSSVEALGTVVSLVSTSNDVRVQYTDLNATLVSLKTEQRALFRLLNQSTTITTTLAIENQLQGVNQQINDIQSQILQINTLVDYATISVTISENSPLILTLKAAPGNGTAPFSITFNAIVKGGSQPYVINYNFGDGSASQGQILIHTYYQSGDFRVTVTVTDQNGTAVTATTKVHVDAAPSQNGLNSFLGTISNLFVGVVEGIIEVAVVVLPLAAVGAVFVIPLRRRAKPQKDPKQSQ